LKMLFYSCFKFLTDKKIRITIELKNGLEITGSLTHVDANLNFNITDISVANPERYPQLLALKNCFIRGSVIRYVHLPEKEIDIELIQEACKKEMIEKHG